MKLNFLKLLLLTAISSAYGQNTLQGVIKNASGTEALAFANIYLPQIEKGATSDENGKFILNDLPDGSFKIVCSFIGFETYSETIVLPFTEVLNITMNPSAIEMEEIIISTPFHKLQSENVMKVERQKLSDLKAEGALNLSDGISDIAGVESVSTGLSIGKPVIRGLSSNRVLVYTQGVRLENQQFGDEHGLGLSDSGIESIEVIKGPASLLYGSDALGGVLYLNPEKFVQQHTASTDASLNYYSNTRGFSTNIGHRSSSETFKFIIRGSLSEHSDYKANSQRITNSRFREQDLKIGLGHQKSNFKTELRYNLNASQLGIPEEIGIQNTSTSPLLPYQDLTSHIFSSKSSIFLKNSRIDANFGFIYNDRKEFEEHHEEEEDHDDEEEEEDHDDEILEPALHMKLKTFNYDLKYNLPKLGKFETIVGVQGMFQKNTNYGEEQLIPNAATNDVGVLATSHIHFETIDVQLGARFDYRAININDAINKDYNSFNGAFGIKTDLSEHSIIRLNLASGFRAPNLAELTSDGTHEGTNRYEIGDLNLKNEQNLQADLALEYKTEHIEIFANVFYNVLRNYIFLSPNGDTIEGDPVFLYVQDDAKLYGGEFGFHWHPHPLDWLHFETNFESVTGRQDNDAYLPLIPANKLNNIIRVEYNTKWVKNGFGFIKLSTAFSQDNTSPFETTTEGYSLLSTGFGGNVTLFKNPLQINMSVTNLLDKDYVNHLSRLRSDGIPNMGRNFNIGLKYEL